MSPFVFSNNNNIPLKKVNSETTKAFAAFDICRSYELW